MIVIKLHHVQYQQLSPCMSGAVVTTLFDTGGDNAVDTSFSYHNIGTKDFKWEKMNVLTTSDSVESSQVLKMITMFYTNNQALCCLV